MCTSYLSTKNQRFDEVYRQKRQLKVEGMSENFVKSWYPTVRNSSSRTGTLLPLSAYATENPGSPTFTLCLSSRQTKE